MGSESPPYVVKGPVHRLRTEEAGIFELARDHIDELMAGRPVTVQASGGLDLLVSPTRVEGDTVAIQVEIQWPQQPAMPMLWEGDGA